MKPDELAAVVVSAFKVALAPMLARVAALESTDVTKEITTMCERLAVLETRPLLPGPPGPAGQDGAPGKDGAPGLEFRGVFLEGQAYERGQLVTWAGASWHCNEPTTTKPGDGSKAWTLMVKKGRDGRDGNDGPPGPTGPRGDNWDESFDKARRR